MHMCARCTQVPPVDEVTSGDTFARGNICNQDVVSVLKKAVANCGLQIMFTPPEAQVKKKTEYFIMYRDGFADDGLPVLSGTDSDEDNDSGEDSDDGAYGSSSSSGGSYYSEDDSVLSGEEEEEEEADTAPIAGKPRARHVTQRSFGKDLGTHA